MNSHMHLQPDTRTKRPGAQRSDLFARALEIRDRCFAPVIPCACHKRPVA